MVQSIDDARRRRDVPRVPPHDLQAEETLLGAMLLSKDAVTAAVEICAPDDFYKPAHGHVFEAIVSLYGQGEPADPVTVADELRRAGLVDAIGGPTTLVSLQANAGPISNAARYARIVEEHALLRRLIGVAGEVAELGYSMPDDVEGAVDRAESMVYEVAQRRVADTMAPLHDLLLASLDRLEMLYERGESITGTPTGFLDLDELLAGLQPSSMVIVGARPGAGKALALDTPIPTPDGWITMGDLAVGDRVFDDKGRPCEVTYTSPTFYGHRCFEVVFDDGTSFVADADHRWFVYDLPAWKSHRSRADRLAAPPPSNPRLARDQSARIRHARVVTTRQMVDEGVRVRDGRPNWYVPLASALDVPEVDVPVDPYVLGCWLGGGTSSNSSMTIGTQDAPHFVAAFREAGYRLEHRGNARDPLHYGTTPLPGTGNWQRPHERYRVLTRELHQVGLLRGTRKHIPVAYLRASAKQRLALLQGVMDTDGYVTPTGAGLCLSNLRLLDDVWELVASLGHKPNPIRYKCVRLADGRTADAWHFSWTPPEPVFRMDRKVATFAARKRSTRNSRSTRRAIVEIREVPTVPTRCISVDSPSHLFLAGRAMVPTHNTSLALGMASHAAVEAGKPVLFFSLEMSHSELTQRLLCAEAKVDSTRLRNGRLHESDWHKISHAIGRLSEAPLYIDDNPNVSVMEIRAKARRLKSKLGDAGLGMIVVDYIQLMTGRRSAENRQVEVSEISRGLKILARELEVPVVALSQLSRNLEMRSDKRPILADLRESGCMPSSTRLLRADNGAEVTLGELVLSQEQPMVWSLDEHWRLVPRRLLRAFPSGVKPVFRLRLVSGREVDATANHPFRTIDGWTSVDELSAGDFIAVPRFLGVAGCHGPRGQRVPEAVNAVDSLKPNPNVDLIPWPGSTQVKASLIAAGRTHRELAAALGESYGGSYLLGSEARPRRFSRERLRRIAAFLESPELSDLATSDVFWDEIIEITCLGEMPTFDATVEDTHNFVANGVIAHNSLEQDADVVMFLYRDELYHPDTPDKGVAEVIVSKHRNGPTGVTSLAWIDRYTRFANMARV